MRKNLIIILILTLALFASACSSFNYNQVMMKPETMFYEGKFKEASRLLIPYINKDPGKNRLLFLMEAGLMLQAANDFENSTKVLLEAASVADKIKFSISAQIQSLIMDQRSTNYKGEVFERILIHMYLGINFLFMKKPEEARVEFKQVNNLLRDAMVSSGKKYEQNLMAKYLFAIAFEELAAIADDSEEKFRENETAYVEYKSIFELDPRMPLIQRDLQRLSKMLDDKEDYNNWLRKFGRRDIMPKDAGELIMIFQAGRSAVKISRGPLLSDQAMSNGINVALRGMPAKQGVTTVAILAALKAAHNPIPKFVKRSNKIKYVNIKVNGQFMGRTYLLEDIEATAMKTLEDDYPALAGKVAAGLVTKVALAIAAKYAAEAAAKAIGGNIGKFANLIGNVAGAGTLAVLIAGIKPDLRCWHTLPANLQLTRIFLPEGTYKFTIEMIDNTGRVWGTIEETLNIQKGRKSFFNLRTCF